MLQEFPRHFLDVVVTQMQLRQLRETRETLGVYSTDGVLLEIHHCEADAAGERISRDLQDIVFRQIKFPQFG